MGKFLGVRDGATLKGVKPEIVDIVKNAIAAIPYDAKIISGERGKGLGNHDHGYAIDVQLYDNGKALPNKGTAAYAAYEQYAQAARVYQKATYPNLPLRTGLGFATVRGGSTLDPMHLDITPGRTMPHYDWETGGTGKYASFSNGGLSGPRGQQLVADYTTALKSGAPASALDAINNMAPSPFNRPTALGYASPTTAPVAPVPRAPIPRSGGSTLPQLPPDAMYGVRGIRADSSQLQMTPGQSYASSSTSANGHPAIARDLLDPRLIAPPGMSPADPVRQNFPLMQGGPAVSAAETRGEQMRPRPAIPPTIPTAPRIQVSETNPDGSDKATGVDALRYPTRAAAADPIGAGPNLVQMLADAGIAPTPMPGRPAALQAASASGAAPIPMPSRPAALQGAPPALPPAPAAPPPQPPQRAPAAPAQQLRLASGKSIAPGIYTQADGHSVMVSDGGNGVAKIERITGPGAIPGVIDPVREASANTIAGGMIRSMIPKVAGQAMSDLSYAAPAALNGATNNAVGAATNLGTTAQNQGGNFLSAFGGMGQAFSPIAASLGLGLPSTPYQAGMLGRGLPSQTAGYSVPAIPRPSWLPNAVYPDARTLLAQQDARQSFPQAGYTPAPVLPRGLPANFYAQPPAAARAPWSPGTPLEDVIDPRLKQNDIAANIGIRLGDTPAGHIGSLLTGGIPQSGILNMMFPTGLGGASSQRPAVPGPGPNGSSGSGTVYSNPTKYGATQQDRQAAAQRRAVLAAFGGN